MSAYDVLDVYASVEKFVRLDVAIVVGLSRLFAVILFRKEARSSQDEAREPVIPMEQLAKVLRRGLCHAVDVTGNGSDILGHPCRRSFGRWCERGAEGAGRAGEDEGFHADRSGFFQEIECARDVNVNEALPSVSEEMRFVQGRRMEDRVYTFHASLDVIPVDYGPDHVREFRMNNINADDLVVRILQRTNQRFTQMTTATCN